MLTLIMVTGNRKTNCFTCKHFYLTWDKQYPRGRKVMGFKSKEMPSQVVFRSSGLGCAIYEKKQ
jgi:hypothetical protein